MLSVDSSRRILAMPNLRRGCSVIACIMTVILCVEPTMISGADNKSSEVLSEWLDSFEETKDQQALLESVRGSGKEACEAMVQAIARRDLAESMRADLISLVPGLVNCASLSTLLDTLVRLESPYLKARLAAVSGSLIRNSDDRELLLYSFHDIEKKLRELLVSGRKYKKLGSWINDIEKFEWWSFAQRRKMSSLRKFGGKEASRADDISSLYWIAFGIRDSMLRQDATERATQLQALSSDKQAGELKSLAESENSFARQIALEAYLGGSPPKLDEAKGIWSDSDVELNCKFIELIGRNQLKKLLGFVLDNIARYCRKLGIRDDISKELLDPDVRDYQPSVELSKLALALEQANSIIGDVREIIAKYGMSNPDYPCPGLLVDLLQAQLWDHRIREGNTDAVEILAINYLDNMAGSVTPELAEKIDALIKDLR